MKNCIVFDFDCTLTYSNYFYLLNGYNKYKEKWGNVLVEHGITEEELPNITTNWSSNRERLTKLIFGGQQRLDDIINFFHILKTNNFDIYISSRGNCDHIHNALTFFGLNTYISYVNANYNVNRCVVENKDVFIEGLKDKYDKIYYVDDVSDEHHSIMFKNKLGNKYTYFGENIGLMDGHNGLTKNMMTIILDRVGIYNLIGGQNIFFHKYIKYKTKYMKLKKLKFR